MGSKMLDGSGFRDFNRLRRSVSGDVFDDSFNRGRYATDASIYQMMPHAVVIPKTADDIVACLAFARDTGTPLFKKLLARLNPIKPATPVINILLFFIKFKLFFL